MAEPAADPKSVEALAPEAHEATAPQVHETPAPEVVSSAEATSPATAADPTPQVNNADDESIAVSPKTGPTESPVMEDKPEPQNPLTERFTKAEWAALKEFRVCAATVSIACYCLACMHG